MKINNHLINFLILSFSFSFLNIFHFLIEFSNLNIKFINFIIIAIQWLIVIHFIPFFLKKIHFLDDYFFYFFKKLIINLNFLLTI